MRVPLSWLQSFVDVAGLTPDELAEGLTCAGLEVESIESIGPRFTRVYVGFVESVDPHPQADKLRLVTVRLSQEDRHTLVCGASNVRSGLLVPLALEGASVYSPKQQAWITLEKAVIRGVPSSGMICSLDELALTDQFAKVEDGIWPLNDRLNMTQVGLPLVDALGLVTDTVFDIAPTANRGDAMSIVGIAREVSAIFERPLLVQKLTDFSVAQDGTLLDVVLTDPDVCTGYMAIRLDNVQVKESPNWVVQRLIACGVRSVNSVVDVTNLVLLELGQPLHAFDWDCLSGQHLNVQRLQSGQFETLSNTHHALTPDVPVVTLDNHPIALAGIMGGAETAVTDKTTRVLLESAHFPSQSTRKGAQSLGLRTEASARYERGVDPTLYRKAVSYAVELLQELCGATVVGSVASLPAVRSVPVITLRYNKLAELYGMDLPQERVKTILTSLGFDVQNATDTELIVTVPTARLHDVTREIDVIEEVVRIAGLDAVPARLPSGSVASLLDGVKQNKSFLITTVLKRLWVAAGFQEVMTPSLVRNDDQDGEIVGVLNSHSPEHTSLRGSLLPNVLDVAATNLNRGQSVLRLFEVGRVYNRQSAKSNARFTSVRESWRCVALLSGQPDSWLPQQANGFYVLKGYMQTVFSGLGLNPTFNPLTEAESYWHPGRMASVAVNGQWVGTIGELHPAYLLAEKLGQRMWLLDLDVSLLANCMPDSNSTIADTSPVSAYPAVQRDISLKVPSGITHLQILSTIRPNADQQDILQEVTLFDVYPDTQTATDERRMAYRLTFQAMDRTLTEDAVKQRLSSVAQSLSQALGIDCPVG